jgi:hypothetical protein
MEMLDFIDLGFKNAGICNCVGVRISQCIADGPVQSPTPTFCISAILQQVMTCDFNDGEKFNYDLEPTSKFCSTTFEGH